MQIKQFAILMFSLAITIAIVMFVIIPNVLEYMINAGGILKIIAITIIVLFLLNELKSIITYMFKGNNKY